MKPGVQRIPGFPPCSSGCVGSEGVTPGLEGCGEDDAAKVTATGERSRAYALLRIYIFSSNPSSTFHKIQASLPRVGDATTMHPTTFRRPLHFARQRFHRAVNDDRRASAPRVALLLFRFGRPE